MRRAIPHLILAVMTIGAICAAVLSYSTAFADSPQINATPNVSLSAVACPSVPTNTTLDVHLSTDLRTTETSAYPVTGEHAFVLIAPNGGKCQSQTAPLEVLKPIVKAGSDTVTAAAWQGTNRQPIIQVISASGVGAAALSCSVSAKAAEALVKYGEPRKLIAQECASIADQLKLTHIDNDVTYFASRDIVTQGNAVVAVRYNHSGPTPQALLVSCGWNASTGNTTNCYDYIASIFASNQ